VQGSVLRWWLAFPQAGFSPAGYYKLSSAHSKLTPQEIAFATGLSIALVNEYLDLIEEMEGTIEKGG